jgi:hypothetical protein
MITEKARCLREAGNSVQVRKAHRLPNREVRTRIAELAVDRRLAALVTGHNQTVLPHNIKASTDRAGAVE